MCTFQASFAGLHSCLATLHCKLEACVLCALMCRCSLLSLANGTGVVAADTQCRQQSQSSIVCISWQVHVVVAMCTSADVLEILTTL